MGKKTIFTLTTISLLSSYANDNSLVFSINKASANDEIRPASNGLQPLLPAGKKKTVPVDEIERFAVSSEKQTGADNMAANDLQPQLPEWMQRQKPVYKYSRTGMNQLDQGMVIDHSRAGVTSYLSEQEYQNLYNRTYNVRQANKFFQDKINIRGELRYHNMFNSADRADWDRDRSGLRLRLLFDTNVYADWRFHTMAEIRKNIKNYRDDINIFERYYLEGHLGQFLTTVGRFGYLMADGNIYDSSFTGIRLRSDDKNSLLNYSLAYGKTRYTQDTFVLTAEYMQSDYRLEAGFYNYKMNYADYGTSDSNSIINLAGEYYMGDFSLGAMYLGASKKDNSGAKNGYVLALKYLETKSWIKGSYSAFLRYYDQPRYTYIAHGMDGLGSWMHGFKGWGLGFSYAFGKNLIGGIEYFDLKEKFSGDKGKTTWFYLSYYF